MPTNNVLISHINIRNNVFTTLEKLALWNYSNFNNLHLTVTFQRKRTSEICRTLDLECRLNCNSTRELGSEKRSRDSLLTTAADFSRARLFLADRTIATGRINKCQRGIEASGPAIDRTTVRDCGLLNGHAGQARTLQSPAQEISILSPTETETSFAAQ